MDGNRTGTTRLTDQQALDFLGPVPPGIPGVNAYMMVPTHGTMEMHSLSIMHGITDDFNVYVAPMWTVDTMHMLLRGGAEVTSSNSGLSDLPFGVLWRVRKTDNDEVILNFGLSADRRHRRHLSHGEWHGDAVSLSDASWSWNLGCLPGDYLQAIL